MYFLSLLIFSKFQKGTAVVGNKDVHDWYTHDNYFIESVILHPAYDVNGGNKDINDDIALVKARV